MSDIEKEQENGYRKIWIMKYQDIERIIFSRKGDWEFDENVSLIFDNHVRRSIPCYNEIQELIGMISNKVLIDNCLIYDLGTATGEVIRSIKRANPNKNIRFIGIDKSAPMLEKAKEKCSGINNVFFHNCEIESFNYRQADLIVAAFTFQFIDSSERQSLLHRIYKALKPNGYFILCEKIIYENSDENDFYIDLYESWKQNHFSRTEIKAKIKLLHTANFRYTNVFFRWSNFVCILAEK